MKPPFAYKELQEFIERIDAAVEESDWEVANSLYTTLMEKFIARISLAEGVDWYVQEQGQAILSRRPERSY